MEKINRVHIDFETFSEVDIKVAGHHCYTRHESFEILCMGIKINDGKTKVFDFYFGDTLSDELIDFLKKPTTKIVAHNASFEMECIHSVHGQKLFKGFKPKPNKFICTAAKAAYHALPRHLSGVASALGVALKDMDAQKSMLYFAVNGPKGRRIPLAPYDDKWVEMLSYCAKDVEAEYAVDNTLIDLPKEEQRLWELDTEINARGILYDKSLAVKVLKLAGIYKERIVNKCLELTGGIAPTQRDALLKWCNDKGADMTGITAEDVRNKLADKNTKGYLRTVLAIRQEASKTSLSKYERMLGADSGDQRLRGMFLYHGATTGRWAGKLVQLHNLPRGINIDGPLAAEYINEVETLEELRVCYHDVMGTFSTTIRATLTCPEDKIIFVADYTGIEARVLGWLADCADYQKAFRDGLDLYKDMASAIYSVPYNKVSKGQRQIGKMAILGLGYGMGVATFEAQAKSFGVVVDDPNLYEIAVKTYRDKYWEIKNLWSELNEAALLAAKCPKKRLYCISNGKVSFKMSDCGRFLKCALPSGRFLHYPFPEVVVTEKTWPSGDKSMVEEIRFWTTLNGSFIKSSTYGGKLCENVVQAIARDLLREGLFAIDDDGEFEVVGTVHDEIIAYGSPESSLEKFEKLMATLPKWADGCIYGTDGYKARRYKK